MSELMSLLEGGRKRHLVGDKWRVSGETLPPGLGDCERATEMAAEAVAMEYISPAQLIGARPDFAKLPLEGCARDECAVCLMDGGSVALVMTNPFDMDRMAWGFHQGAMKTVLASLEAFERWLEAAASRADAGTMVRVNDLAESGAKEKAEVLSITSLSQDESDVVRFVNATLIEAMKAGASDVHLESFDSGMAVKFRIDGVLGIQTTVRSSLLAQQAISRVKVLSDLDIAERRVPQDGRLQLMYEGRRIDVRVSVIPSIHGEDAVLRVLDREHLATEVHGLTLANLGIDQATAEQLRQAGKRAHGMVLMTGPTGSGKTTTVYAVMAETQDARQKVITIEDPVEYQLKEVLQIPVNDRKGLSFATGLRSILRHDPDKILVGEIRDAETAQIAVQAALTGHLVFTTIHANTAMDAIGRFAQLGIDPYDFSSAVNCVVAQRLLRSVCASCKAEPRAAMTCHGCRQTGFSGRFAVAEVLELSDELKALIGQKAPRASIEEAARKTGWRPLKELASAHVESGRTTQEEVDRVVQ